MSDGTKIEWTKRPGTIGATMNALVGCQKVSQGCAHCYAIEVAHIRAGQRLPVMQEKFGGTTRVEGGKRVWTGKVTLSESALLAPLKAKRPRTYFVNALSDLFYDQVPDEWIDRHFAVFALCPQHTFIVLTKRPERMRAYVSTRQTNIRMKAGDFAFDLISLKKFEHIPSPSNAPIVYDLGADGDECGCRVDMKWPLRNVWLGVSVEDQNTADGRIPLLLRTPAAVRFISAEPLLGSVDFRRRCPAMCKGECGYPSPYELLGAVLPESPLIDWVICGGESGPGARPMHPQWARELRDQCVAAGVPFFFKQWGAWLPWEPESGPCWVSQAGRSEDHHALFPTDIADDPPGWDSGMGYDDVSHAAFQRVGKKAAGNLLDGRRWQEFPDGRVG